MDTSAALELHDDAQAPANYGYFPLLGIALGLVAAFVTYGPALYFVLGK